MYLHPGHIILLEGGDLVFKPRHFMYMKERRDEKKKNLDCSRATVGLEK